MSKPGIVINVLFLLTPIISFLLGHTIILENWLIIVIALTMILEYFLNHKTFSLLSQLTKIDETISNDKYNVLLFLKKTWTKYNVIAITIIILMATSIMFREMQPQLTILSGITWMLYIINSLLDKVMSKARFVYVDLVNGGKK